MFAAAPPPDLIGLQKRLQLAWDFTNKAEQAILSAFANVRKLIDDISLHVISHDAYGKVQPPSHMPDRPRWLAGRAERRPCLPHFSATSWWKSVDRSHPPWHTNGRMRTRDGYPRASSKSATSRRTRSSRWPCSSPISATRTRLRSPTVCARVERRARLPVACAECHVRPSAAALRLCSAVFSRRRRCVAQSRP